MIEWLTWGVLLFLQQATHTASSRAKNSSSLWYCATAGFFSHAVWYLSTFFLVKHQQAAQSGGGRLWSSFAFYVTLCVIGGVVAQRFLIVYERKRGLDRG